ncbi:MAG: hydrogenase maturation protease [Nitrospirae bacterium]|nr:hydrogenase maturation protease [Nitrospirota bacterium]
MKRIICIGNRYVRQDSAGPAVYDLLSQEELPADVELVDGGLAGLNLLGFFDDAELVVLVDNVSGFSSHNGTVVLEPEDIVPLAKNIYDHASGLPYLLRALPEVIEGNAPRIVVVGVEGDYDESVIADAARLALKTAADLGRGRLVVDGTPGGA